jgi:hypothetical protein
MLRQQRIGQGKIGFEFANAGSIDQGRQLMLGKNSVSRRLSVYDYDYVYGHELG